MADMTYNSITITDLVDSATYIYYSATGSSEITTDWHINVESTDSYIGFYEGPPDEGGQQPENPTPEILEQLQIKKYVGHDGKGIVSTIIEYAESPSGINPPEHGWQSTPIDVAPGHYLWTRTTINYSEGDPSISYSVSRNGEDGEDSSSYRIVSNQEKIYKFYSSEEGFLFSPNSISFQLYKTEDEADILLNPLTDYDNDLSVAGNLNLTHLWSLFNRLTGKSRNKQHNEQREEIIVNILDIARTITNTSVTFNFVELNNYEVAEFSYIYTSITEEEFNRDKIKYYTYNSSFDIYIQCTSADVFLPSIKYYIYERLGENTSEDVALFNEFLNLLNNDNIYLLYKVFTFNSSSLEPSDDDLIGIKGIPLEFGTSNDMARFALTANTIQMAVNESKLEFDANGLKIYNGGLEILRDNGDNTKTQVLYSDESGNLTIKGIIFAQDGEFNGTVYATNGEFTGIIHASDGDFSGEINASSGTIGGFNIQSNRLVSTDGSIELIGMLPIYSPVSITKQDFDQNKSKYYTYNQELNSYIQCTDEDEYSVDEIYYIVSNSESKIIANNIELGQSAVISDSLTIGNAHIYNPDKYNGLFIDANNLKINDDGTVDLGNIVLDSNNSSIYAKNDSWYINGDKAFFKDIEISGTAHSLLFTTDSIQTCGGMVIYKPCTNITTNDNGLIFKFENIEDASLFALDDWVMLSGEGQSPYITQISNLDVENNIIEFLVNENDQLSTKYTSMLLLANITNENDSLTNNLIIGVNSTTNPYNQLLYPSGITFISPKLYSVGPATKGIKTTPDLFLGDLKGLGIDNINGYGLYGNNVYLTGSLTTLVNSDVMPSYAGVNTLNGANANKFENTDTSKIVFWAGSTGINNDEIAESPFQVTEQGSLYAAQGRFEGAIITKSEIRGADIYAARIHGTAAKEEGKFYGLAFYDANEGIIFNKGDGPLAEEVFTIGTNGLKKGNEESYFISLKNNLVEFNSNNLNTNTAYFLNTNSIKINNGKISSVLKNGTSSEIEGNYIDILSDKLDLNDKLIIKENLITNNVNTTQFKKEVVFGMEKDNGKLNYKPVNDGYDLYVEVG